MKLKTAMAFLATLLICVFAGCQDETSELGESLAPGEVAIVCDSTFTLTGESVYTPVFDSRSTTNLLGSLSVPEYGNLHCTFVTRLMCAAKLNVEDTITSAEVDSMKMYLRVARGALTGDSLAPQRLNVYALTKQLPDDINNSFNPEGYYSRQSLIGSKTFTLSALNTQDSIFTKATYINIPIMLPLEYARSVFDKYRNEPSIFEWPSTFREYLPGLYVEPSFGRGCVANVSRIETLLYYHRMVSSTSTDDDGETVTVWSPQRDSVTVFSTAPEVLSSNNIHYDVSEFIKERIAAGHTMIVAPAGYNVSIHLPVAEVLTKFKEASGDVNVLNNLSLSIPASKVQNDYGIGLPYDLLMVRTSELDEFFANNKVPDSKTSFWLEYSSSTGCYSVSSMRQFLIDALASGVPYDEIDSNFTLVPVTVTTEQKQTGYSTTTAVVTACTPYILSPVMVDLHLDRAKIKFTYSLQRI